MLAQGCVDIEEAAKILGVSVSRAYAIVNSSPIVTTRAWGGTVYFTRESLEKHVSAQRPGAEWTSLRESLGLWSETTIRKRIRAGKIEKRRFGRNVYFRGIEALEPKRSI